MRNVILAAAFLVSGCVARTLPPEGADGELAWPWGESEPITYCEVQSGPVDHVARIVTRTGTRQRTVLVWFAAPGEPMPATASSWVAGPDGMPLGITEECTGTAELGAAAWLFVLECGDGVERRITATACFFAELEW